MRLVTVLTGLLAMNPVLAGDGVYTAEQAGNGKKAYDEYCAECHHMSLKGTGHGTQLVGPNFLARWGGQSMADFISYNRETMPPQAIGTLIESMIIDIVAHILQVNGSVAGEQALSADSDLVRGGAS